MMDVTVANFEEEVIAASSSKLATVTSIMLRVCVGIKN